MHLYQRALFIYLRLNGYWITILVWLGIQMRWFHCFSEVTSTLSKREVAGVAYWSGISAFSGLRGQSQGVDAHGPIAGAGMLQGLSLKRWLVEDKTYWKNDEWGNDFRMIMNDPYTCEAGWLWVILPFPAKHQREDLIRKCQKMPKVAVKSAKWLYRKCCIIDFQGNRSRLVHQVCLRRGIVDELPFCCAILSHHEP